jgi:hypothetical protein
MSLTPKQEKFARIFATNGNATKAYREVYATNGAPDSTVNTDAYRLTIHPEIAPRIQEIIERSLVARDITPETVIAGIQSQVDGATSRGNDGPAMRGWELLGKYLKLWDDTAPAVDNSQHLNILANLSVDELRELLGSAVQAQASLPEPEQPDGSTDA